MSSESPAPVPLVWGLQPNVVVSMVLISVILIIFLYDAIALMFWDHTYTISYVVKSWSRYFPILPLVVGICLGHLFWPVVSNETGTPRESLRNGHTVTTTEATVRIPR